MVSGQHVGTRNKFNVRPDGSPCIAYKRPPWCKPHRLPLLRASSSALFDQLGVFLYLESDEVAVVLVVLGDSFGPTLKKIHGKSFYKLSNENYSPIFNKFLVAQFRGREAGKASPGLEHLQRKVALRDESP